ncbi:mannitol 1-phosphate dehydrogenase 2 [Boeremia exigua]|uniref:mannitol 1-phosphate dehydrogenase 2 n=1 Tax=Boeremia exigua TaxID=749465 RepID=UPI001E8CC088|nr:mannitol 1-phosphate dehydrogenase 2 [Boeremia exigua]KAH6637545.1 mannitol 1-phosphate dehydrogenase 2 [Boeremia exigua]
MASTDSPKREYNLAIVGGGISGLCLAITLLRYDIPITVYEAASHFGEIGAGVYLGPNAGRAMKLMSPKIHEAFTKTKTGNQWKEKEDSWFTIRVGDERRADKDGFVKPGKRVGDALFDVPMAAGGDRGGVYRAAFLNELVKDIPDNIARFGKRLVDLSNAKDDSGDMVLHFADGTTAQHSAVIGCDGIKSKTRPWLLGKDDPASFAEYSGKYAYRGLIPMEKAIPLLGEEVAANSSIFMGYHGHILTFPVQKGKTMNVVAFNSSKTWDDEKWVITTSKEQMEADFADWGPQVQKIVGAMEKPDVWALFMHPPCNTFYKGRLCLLGDAAHATTPHQGAGAGMCIEDSYILANLVKEASDVDGLERAFKAFDQVRRERSQKNVTTSQEAGMLYDLELFGDDLEKIEHSFLTRMQWIWEFDIEKQLEEAQKIMRGETVET